MKFHLRGPVKRRIAKLISHRRESQTKRLKFRRLRARILQNSIDTERTESLVRAEIDCQSGIGPGETPGHVKIIPGIATFRASGARRQKEAGVAELRTTWRVKSRKRADGHQSTCNMRLNRMRRSVSGSRVVIHARHYD